MTAHRVLITDGDQRSALAIVRSLGRAGYSVFVCSSSGCSIAGASRYAMAEARAADPAHDPAGFVDTISRLTERWAIDVLLPVTDASCVALLPFRARLTGVRVLLPDEDAYRAISDKRALLENARSLGIQTPEQIVLEDPAARFAAAATDLEFPLFVKPARSVSETADGGLIRLGVVPVASEEELAGVLSSLAPAAYPVLLQRRIEGPGVGVFFLRWNGHTVARFCHRRIREKPPSGGVSVYRESISLDESLAEKSEALLGSYRWHGVAMVEYKIESSTGRAFLMEVNGRFWGSLQLAIDSGVDFPRLLMERALGHRVAEPQPSYEVGVRSRWWWGDLDQLLLRLRHSKRQLGLGPSDPGRLRALIEFMVLWRPGDRSEVLRLRDPRPFVRESVRWLKRQ